jgi:hypothetical protein
MKTFLPLLLLATAGSAYGELKSINPTVKKIVDEVSEERIAANLKKLETFGTRDIFSSQEDEVTGIGAARRWISAQFKSYSPRLQVSFDQYKVKKKNRIFRDTDLYNVVAILPGTKDPDHQFILSAHYDSVALKRRAEGEPPASGDELTYSEETLLKTAPGVTDDGSGTATVMELARVMSQYEFEKTIVFITFAGEEEGLIGASLYARKAHAAKQKIDGVLNNDIIGSDVAGNGRSDNDLVWIFSEEPNDSGSRQVARYMHEIGERYVPSMKVGMVFRHDRFGRGGDHTPFNQEGYAAVRVTTPNENFANQHSATDTFANTSVPYTTRVAKINAASLASLALAPKAPMVNEEIQKGPRKGQFTPLISRGKTRYDARLRWKTENAEEDLAGYVVVYRQTTSADWEHEIFVGNVTEFELKDISIDNLVFGVKAVDKDGNESLVSAYVQAPRNKAEIETY